MLYYVSAIVETVQEQISNQMDRIGLKHLVLTYTMNRREALRQSPVETLSYQSKSAARGPILYLKRHRDAARFFMKHISFSKDDVLHANMMFGDGSVCRYISERRNTRYVVTVRNTDLNVRFLWRLPWIRKTGLRVLQGADRVIFLSEAYRKELLSRIPDPARETVGKKSVIIPNGIDDFWFDHAYRPHEGVSDPVRILTVGRIERNKNQVTVAKAIDHLIRENGSNARYTVIGDVSDDAYAGELRQYPFVEFKPFMPKEELIAEMRSADLYVMVSYTESFGLVYAEALTQGLPIVYTKGQGFDGQFEEGAVGCSADSHDAESVAAAILRILPRYREIGRNTVPCSQRFRWSSCIREIAACYEAKPETGNCQNE